MHSYLLLKKFIFIFIFFVGIQHSFSQPSKKLRFLVQPYLQLVTTNSITVMCEVTKKSKAILHYGEDASCKQKKIVDERKKMHEIKISSLQSDTQYFYYYEIRCGEKSIKSKVSTFQTAPVGDSPVTFAIISDPQGNPKVSKKLANYAWEQRPHFLLIPGDLVVTGRNKQHWLKHFFPGMRPLIERVAFFSVLGNHEQNAKYYYNYVSLPDPEYYYTFTYGNIQFFMIDSNKKTDPSSEQYKWLEKELEKSDAYWKFVCHHHPVYSSDENDFGNLWKVNKSTRGNLNVRHLAKLYDKYKVDIIWNGHIHSYERTWPVKNGKAVNFNDGPIYMITGGGGGSLETPGPSRPFFQNTVRRGHHYSMARVNKNRFEFFAYDLDGRLFDTFTVSKK